MSTATVSGGVTISAATVTLTGSVVGMGYDVLLAAFVGLLFGLHMLPEMDKPRLFFTAVSNVMLSAWAAPVVALYVAGPEATRGSIDAIRMLSACLMGAGGPVLFPSAILAAGHLIKNFRWGAQK